MTPRPTPHQTKARTVYFIRPVGMKGPIKIGCSCSPDTRRETLSTWSPFPLEIAAEIPGNMVIERQFHALFLRSHQRREWFDWSPEIEEVIDAINAGSFDVSTLPDPAMVAHRTKGNSRKRTPAQCRQFSISIRSAHLLRRSGYSCPARTSEVVYRGDPAELAVVEQWLSDPSSNGLPIDAPWAVKARAAFHAKHPKQARAA